MPLTTLIVADTRWATDLDLFLEIGDDYSQIVYDSQKLARGYDGAMTIAAPFTLTSATIDFQANEVAAGRIVKLTGSQNSATGRLFGAEEHAAVDSVAGGTLVLRRPDQIATGLGQPYVWRVTFDKSEYTVFSDASSPVKSPVHFVIQHFDPQMARATAEVRTELRRRASDADIAVQAEDGELRDIVVHVVAARAYRNKSAATTTDAGDVGGDSFLRKAKEHEAAAQMLLDALYLRVQGLPPVAEAGEASNVLHSGSLQIMRPSGWKINQAAV